MGKVLERVSFRFMGILMTGMSAFDVEVHGLSFGGRQECEAEDQHPEEFRIFRGHVSLDTVKPFRRLMAPCPNCKAPDGEHDP